MINKCNTFTINSLCKHRETNVDLFLTQCTRAKSLPISYEWVQGHADEHPWPSVQDLVSQHLKREEVYNIWCDQMAHQEWSSRPASYHDPEVSPEERRAIFMDHPSHHKITGNLSTCLIEALGFQATMEYISKRRNLSLSDIDHINFHALQKALNTQKVHVRANTSKIVHNWTPTYAHLCQQGHEATSLCPRCFNRVEITNHVYQCPNPETTAKYEALLREFLHSLVAIHTPIQLICTFEYKLSCVSIHVYSGHSSSILTET